MHEDEQLNILRNDILRLYNYRKQELDPMKIEKIERQIASKLKNWGDLLNKNKNNIYM